MSKAADILKRYKTVNEGEDQVGGKPKGKEQVGDGGDANMRGIIEKMVKENWSKDNDSQMSAVSEMKKLAESDDPMTNKFMEYMDKASSDFSIKEALDGSDNTGAKDADDESEEEGKYKKKDGPEFGEKKGKK